jgi:sulfatase maturation enzyme AslB (radical SAM superfamily)
MDGDQQTQDYQRPFLNGKGSFKLVIATIAKLDQISFPYHIRATVRRKDFLV